MALDAIEQATWTRQQQGVLNFKDVVHHTDRGSQGSGVTVMDRVTGQWVAFPGPARGRGADRSFDEHGLFG
jgi:putative transposase